MHLRRKLLLAGLGICFQLFSSIEVRGDVNGLLREVYSGIGGSVLANLTNASIYPNSPTSSNLVTDFFEAPVNSADNYGQRMRGLVVAPVTGNYIFWICSDDQGALYLSTTELPANKRLIAVEPQWGNSRDWDGTARRTGGTNFFPSMNPNLPANRSDYAFGTITLQAGSRYYIEAVSKEGTGGDNLAVQWQLPGGAKEGPIPATRLIAVGVNPPMPPVITSQPTNLTVGEGASATFNIQVTSFAPPSYQWQRSGTNLPGATSTNYTLGAATVADTGVHFRCVISSGLGTNTSVDAILTVNPDRTPPTIFGVASEGLTNVVVHFSEAVDAVTAQNPFSYQISGGVVVVGAAFFGNGSADAIRLTTSPLTAGSNFILTVNNVRDRATTPNPIAANSQMGFTALSQTLWDIGEANGGNLLPRTNGFRLSLLGGDIGQSSDQLTLAYQRRTGDFDVQVRVQSLDLTDPWAKAGLMARETLETNSTFAASLATPSISGSVFAFRSTTGGASATSGFLPVNYPNTWVRLQRVGNIFTGLGSMDGLNWTILGSTTIAMSNSVYLGLTVGSRNPQLTAGAEFRDLADTSGGVIGPGPVALDPPGPSSRRTGLIFSELNYHPRTRADGRQTEFIEIMNTQPFDESMGGFRISGDVDFTFPTNTFIPAGGFLLVARNPADLQSVYSLTGVFGPYTNKLGSSGTIRLRDRRDAVLLEVSYDSKYPWPVAADGAGHSLVLKHPSYGEGNPKAWDISDRVGGSPGAFDGFQFEPARNVVINEFLAHTDPPLLDYIELYNHGNQPIDVSGFFLSDDPATNRFAIPPGTILPARGFLSFNQNQLGFALSAAGETIYFRNAGDTRVIDAVRFEGQSNSVSMGRVPDGGQEFYPQSARTPGAANTTAVVSDIVINEIMPSPLSGDPDDTYVELFNRGNAGVNLGGWRFIEGINFTFPSNTVLASHAYFVLGKNAARLRTNYNYLASSSVFEFSGSLAGGGERLALARPDAQVTTNLSGGSVTNTAYVVMDEVTYATGGRWPKWAGDGGSSLELTDPRGNHRAAANWADSDETAKGAWTNIEYTGVLDNGTTNVAIDSIQILLLGEGECLVDNVEVIGPGGTNLLANSDFETGTSGWFFQGNHDTSSLETTGGFGTGQCLHVRATGRGDTGANRIRATLSAIMAPTNSATLRFKVRWLKGNPEILMRLHGNWLEAAGRMATPSNPGTPGLPNSRGVANQGPAISGVGHAPVLPAGGQPVVVTAQVQDPDGLASLVLSYRIDPATSNSSINMVDDGTGGDAVAGDGIFSATIPGQGSGTLVAFSIRAVDSPGATANFPADAPVRECLVRFGESQPSGNFGTYRIWMTQATVNRWASREHNSNEPLDVTFVYGNQRVIYNAQSLYSGSPFHTPSYTSPVGTLCDYVVTFPDDDLFLGVNDFVLATLGNLGSDTSAQREQFAFWLLREIGVPGDYRRYVNLFVNGLQRGIIYEDAQQPNSEVVKEFFPDDHDGELHKIEDWFEFDNTGDVHPVNTDATLQNFTTTGGVHKTARYRWNWRKRAVKDSANDYSDLFSLVDAVNAGAPDPFTFQTDSLMDVDEWMRVMAVEHFVGNWDSYGYQRGKNMYAYKPVNGKWQLLPWDIDFLLGLGGDNATTSLFVSFEPVVARILAHPPFRRNYLRAFQDLLNGPLVDAQANPVLDGKYSAFRGNGIAATDPSAIKSYIASRKSYVASQLATASAPFSITSNGGNDFSTNGNFVTLAGQAGLDTATIQVNGVRYTPTWTTVTNWAVRLALGSGPNALAVQGVDRFGSPLAGASDTIRITNSGASASPLGYLTINEIMYHPTASNAAYVEIYNNSSNTAFDLSGYRLDGVDYTFDPGTVLGPQGYLLVVESIADFANAYGLNFPIAGAYSGKLKGTGETLRLIQPGATPELDVIVDEVTYSNLPPWPGLADGGGSSLQLIDPTRDHWRVANWGTVTNSGSVVGSVAPPAWQFISATGTASTSRLYIYTDGPADFYLDDISLVAGTVPALGSNYVQDAGFESTLSPPWTVSANLAGSSNSAALSHSGARSLHVVATAAGSSQGTSIWQDTFTLVTNNPYALGFWVWPATNSVNVIVRLSGSGIATTNNIQQPTNTIPGTAFTPGASNSVNAALPAFPLLWINEIQPNNGNGITNRLGEHQPWIELFNSGTNSISLSNYFLTDAYTNLTRWSFPVGAILAPGAFAVVWADGNSNNTTAAEWHTGFRLSSTNGSIALSRLLSGQVQVIDYLDYGTLATNRSFGSFPDGQSKARQLFSQVTGGGTNNPAFSAVAVVINEFMASNTRTLADPADGHFDDWIELYNMGGTAVDLSGFTMTDTLSNPGQWTIPAGSVIQPHSFLIVWADGDLTQNGLSADLHASFQLSKGGEAIGLYAPGGVLVDSITFGAQISDVSQGRFPDGSGSFYFLTNATPRLRNIYPASNSPPVLATIAGRVINEGSLLSIALSASDPDAPPQSLVYSLDPGFPTGLSINATNGLINWIPSEAQGPGVYPVTVRVTDNGSPALSDVKTFSITVNEVNSVPVLSAVSSQIIPLGGSLRFTNTATDSDLPLQSLRFSLDPGSPDGAAVDAVTGAFSWTPSAAQSPGSYAITVRVTDDGTPSLSDAQTFSVAVLGPPKFTTLTLSSSNLVLSLQTAPGKNYQLLFTPNLSPPAWTNLTTFPGTGLQLNITNDLGTNQSGFFQIWQTD